MDLLEREAEYAALGTLIDDVAGGRSGLVVLDGPAGAGKSALLAALPGLAGPAGVNLVAGRATELGRDVPFGLARRLLEPAIRAAPGALQTGWARQARPLFAGELDGAGSAAPLVDGLVALVAELIRARGAAILAVDDAQWADPSSLAFLAELADRRAEIGVGLAVAIRTGDAASDESVLRRLRAAPGARVLAPAPLSAAAVAALVSARLARPRPGLAERVATASAGNPLLVTELLAAAERNGTSDLLVPESVARTVLLRLDGVDPAARALAEAVAVLGDTPLRRAAELAGLEGASPDAAADDLAARHVLAAGEPLRFLQPVVAEALTGALPAFERAARHRRAAELLAADGEDEDRIAAHLVLTRPAGDAWAYGVLRRAARGALGRGDPDTAVRLLERALDEPAPAADRGHALVELARARAGAGVPSAIDAFEQALSHVVDPAERIAAWHGLSRLLYVREDHAAAAEAARRGLAELAPDDPSRERLLADELAGAILVPELAADAAARTEALIGQAAPAEPALLAQVIVHQAWRGIEVRRLPELARAAVASDPLVDAEARGFALAFVAGALNMTDEVGLAEELLGAGLERAMALGDPLTEVCLRCCRAWARIYGGRLGAAAEDLDAVLAMRRLEWSSIDGLSGPPLVVLRLELGDLPGAREALAMAARGAQPGLQWFEGSVALATGDAAAALAAFESAGAVLEGVLALGNPGVLPWRSGAALAAFRLGDAGRARELAAAEVEQARAVGVPRALGVALRTAGLVGGDTELLAESVEVLERSAARLELARSLMFLGIAHRRARRARDARAPLGRGLDLARACGATELAARALAELQAAGARPRNRPRAGAEALTASERRVAELAATGQTTRQIAGALFLSPKTVEGHLTSVFRKLGVSSRTELAPLLARRP